jgi:hypothetical protein
MKKLEKEMFLASSVPDPEPERNLVYGSKDPDPSQNVTDPEHCFTKVICFLYVTRLKRGILLLRKVS